MSFYNGCNFDEGSLIEMRRIHVELEQVSLWREFNECDNEMIVTKNGRRMFPVIRAKIAGLEENAFYSVFLEFKQIDDNRWKYINGEWLHGGKAEPPPLDAVYKHPDSPNYGRHWMKETLNFAKVKLTNKSTGEGQIMLNSLHKYEPRIHVVRVDTRQPSSSDFGELSKTFRRENVRTFPFPDTRFIAVTAYQNEDVTQLKIKYNPFAKAFQDNKVLRSRSYRAQRKSPDSVSEQQQQLLQQRLIQQQEHQQQQQPLAHTQQSQPQNLHQDQSSYYYPHPQSYKNDYHQPIPYQQQTQDSAHQQHWSNFYGGDNGVYPSSWLTTMNAIAAVTTTTKNTQISPSTSSGKSSDSPPPTSTPYHQQQPSYNAYYNNQYHNQWAYNSYGYPHHHQGDYSYTQNQVENNEVSCKVESVTPPSSSSTPGKSPEGSAETWIIGQVEPLLLN